MMTDTLVIAITIVRYMPEERDNFTRYVEQDTGSNGSQVKTSVILDYEKDN